MSAHRLYTARLARSQQLSPQTFHLEFAVEGVSRFAFVAGQWLSVHAQHSGQKMTRAYSIASAPRHDNTFDLCLNRVPGGFLSHYLCELPLGAEVKFHGPYGNFILHSPVRDALFVANGTGIAPIRGMLQWLFADAERHHGRHFWLVFGVRFQPDLYYHDEFLDLAGRHPNFGYLPTLSRPGADWKGAQGYVQEHLPGIAAGRTGTDAYICGLQNMVSATRTLLKELGWDRQSIRYEKYD